MSAPTFNLIKADYLNFLLHWVEWIDTESLGTDAVLSSDIGGQYHIGNYASSANTVYLNPLKQTTDSAETSWRRSQLAFHIDDRDPAKFLPTSVGEVLYKPRMAGPFKDEQTTKMDSGLIFKMQLDHGEYATHNYYHNVKPNIEDVENYNYSID